MKIAIIPARGGSKRIPRKNIREFMGKPIIAWPIETAIESGLFDRVIVSTDDIEIKKVALEHGAEVPFMRPRELADDYTVTNAVVKHAIQWLSGHGTPVKYVCCIYATTPFLQPRYLLEGYDKLISSGKDYAFTVCPFPSAIKRALRITKAGYIEAIWPKNTQIRSQDMEEAYYDAGQFYWGHSDAFLTEKITHSSASVPVILPRVLAQDIDTLEDWHQAELIFETLR